MVKQTRQIFGLKEIRGVRFQCANPECSCEVVDSPSGKMPSSCPSCNADWKVRNLDGGYGPNRLLVRAIADVLGAGDLPVNVRFEIDGDDKPNE